MISFTMDYAKNKRELEFFYELIGISSEFNKDNIYLEEAFNDINKIWNDNLSRIDTVKYLMIAEAPLWGEEKKYIYNPNTNNSQFFRRSDLGEVLKEHIADKQSFLKRCSDIGLIVVDISPFALNPKNTAINYRKLTKTQYKQLVSLTIPDFFERKIKALQPKITSGVKVFFRYEKVKTAFQDIISPVLIGHNFIELNKDIEHISKRGGNIDKNKLAQIMADEN